MPHPEGRVGIVPGLSHLMLATARRCAFWRYLLDAHHQPTLWAPALRHAFPHLRPRVRTEVYDRLVLLHALRNRIAHHEPIHHLPLDQRIDDLLTLVGFLCPTTATWIWSTTRIPALLAARPS
jgi:hypothetical protein